ncbi:MAG TPA: hypothetical protein VG722_08555 [Tepidisphaeraceae bacterium]|nr:hypothetical protein [Tepidisphaeraceae bacterium]
MIKNPPDDEDATSAQLWHAWQEKGKQHERAIARKIRVVAGVLISLLAAAYALYSFGKK